MNTQTTSEPEKPAPIRSTDGFCRVCGKKHPAEEIRNLNIYVFWSEGVNHPTEKPVELLQKLIESSTLHGESILDPFVGSGSTLVAAHREGRYAVGIELEERHCETAAKRLEQLGAW